MLIIAYNRFFTSWLPSPYVLHTADALQTAKLLTAAQFLRITINRLCKFRWPFSHTIKNINYMHTFTGHRHTLCEKRTLYTIACLLTLLLNNKNILLPLVGSCALIDDLWITLNFCNARSTPATMSKQHCRMLQCRMLLRQSRTLLRHCC